jgi:hypothetical protein
MHRNAHSLVTKSDGKRTTDAASGTCNQRDFSLEHHCGATG